VTDDPDDWLMISASTAGAAGTVRVQVWRKLRSLGALYLQQSVCLLPAREDVERQVRRLTDRIHQQGGSVRVLRMRFADPVQEQSVVEEFNAARDAEYAEVLERIPALREELAQERARGRATYAEVEESEADLERFRSWLRATTSPHRVAKRPSVRWRGLLPTWRISNERRCRPRPQRPCLHQRRRGYGGWINRDRLNLVGHGNWNCQRIAACLGRVCDRVGDPAPSRWTGARSVADPARRAAAYSPPGRG
jgi:hypothetical protein